MPNNSVVIEVQNYFKKYKSKVTSGTNIVSLYNRMKNTRKIKVPALALLLFIGLTLQSMTISRTAHGGINFYTGSFKNAKAKALSTDKGIFIDAYTEWCGPCKKMSRDVFTNHQVGHFYNERFINLKIDMEKGEGLFLGRKFGVTSYPTLLYLDKNGKLIKKVEGALNIKAFLAAGKEAAE